MGITEKETRYKQELQILKAEVIQLKTMLKERDLTIQSATGFNKEIEQKLRLAEDTETQLNRLLDISFDAVFFSDLEGNICSVNKAGLTVFGYEDISEIEGKSITEFVHPGQVERIRNIINDLVAQKDEVTTECTFVRKGGNEFLGEITCCYLTNQPPVILINIRQISVQETEEQQARQIEYLIKLSVIQGEISKATTIAELKQFVCRQLLDLTLAEELWVLETQPLGDINLLVTHYDLDAVDFMFNEYQLEINDVDERFLKMPHTPNGGYLLEEKNVIHLTEFNSQGSISLQYLISIRLKSGAFIQFGLNYYQPIQKKQIDSRLLQNLYGHLSPAFESICAQEKLKDNETKFRALTEKMSDITLVRDAKGLYTYVSPSIKQYGIELIDIIGKSAEDFIHENDKDRVAKIVADIIPKPGSSVRIDAVKINDSLKANLVVDLTVTNLLNQKGVEGIVVNIRDITERIHFESKMAENELRLRNIFESMQDGVYLCSRDFVLEYANNAMKQQFGEDFIGKNCHYFVFGSEGNCEWCVANNLKVGEHTKIEVFNPKNKRHYQISKSVISSKGGNSILHISRDITELKEAELLIRQNEEKFRNIFNYSNDAIFITDTLGNYLEVNDRAVERTGFSKEKFLDKNLTDLTDYSKVNNAADYLQEVILKGQATKELWYQHELNLKIIYTEISGKLIEYQDGKAILHVSRDITKRKKLERDILESTIKTEEAERSRFARDLHDGIGPYLSASKLLLKSLTRTYDEEERMQVTEKALNSIDEIIRNVKEISNNISPHVLQNFGLLAAIHSFRKKLMIQLPEINISSNIEDSRFNVNLEITIFRIVIELINNTLKYAKAHTIDVAIMLSDTVLSVQYYDDGMGFNLDEVLNQKSGSGLFNIITRVKSLGGEYDFETAPGHAFFFKARFKSVITK